MLKYLYPPQKLVACDFRNRVHDQLSVLLSLRFTLFLSHGYLAPKPIETTIVQIIKNKCGNISSSNNYRPIALATIIYKLLESILLMKCEEYLCTSANQFGFKKTHGTELCIILRYVLSYLLYYFKIIY